MKSLIQYIKAIFSCSYNRVIFLDFDGVLVPDNGTWGWRKDYYGREFHPRCVNCLKEIIEATDAKIVITSSWRGYLSLWQLIRMWNARNMPGEIIGATEQISIYRGVEIDEWISKHKFSGRYVILDDMTYRQFESHQHHNIVTIYGGRGLTNADAELAIKILLSTSEMLEFQ